MTAPDPIRPASVCIVDDDDAWRELLRLVLETRCGVADVETFADGAAALRRVREHPTAIPRLMLLDYHMPRMNGRAVLAALRTVPHAPPVAVLSNGATHQERDACLRGGAFAFLPKAVRADEPSRALQDLLERAARATAALRTWRVVVADDHELVRSGFAALLSLMPGVEVVAEARNGTQLLEALVHAQADLVLCDLSMPGMDGMEALDRMAQLHPQVRTVIVSMDFAPGTVRRALARGAAGFVAKQAATAELEDAIRTVARGGRYLSPALEAAMRTRTDDAPDVQLTGRQTEILTLVAQGHTARDIAQQLGLSPNTVDVHRARIMERLGLHDIPGLTRYAMKHGLVR